jgi:hypothetical protein
MKIEYHLDYMGEFFFLNSPENHLEGSLLLHGGVFRKFREVSLQPVRLNGIEADLSTYHLLNAIYEEFGEAKGVKLKFRVNLSSREIGRDLPCVVYNQDFTAGSLCDLESHVKKSPV